jgi:hypothetical protein
LNRESERIPRRLLQGIFKRLSEERFAAERLEGK